MASKDFYLACIPSDLEANLLSVARGYSCCFVSLQKFPCLWNNSIQLLLGMTETIFFYISFRFLSKLYVNIGTSKQYQCCYLHPCPTFILLGLKSKGRKCKNLIKMVLQSVQVRKIRGTPSPLWQRCDMPQTTTHPLRGTAYRLFFELTSIKSVV